MNHPTSIFIPAASQKPMPWKNGGGITTEIKIYPEGSTIDNFEWRLSMAKVESNGPFSLFEHVDRTLLILSGNGIFLAEQESDNAVTLTQDSKPYSYPADIPYRAALISGPITDLNFMTDRRRWTHKISQHKITLPEQISIPAKMSLLLARNGSMEIKSYESFTLNRHDCVLFLNPIEQIQVSTKSIADLIIIHLNPVEQDLAFA